MRRNSTFGARKHASSHEHDGADPISSIGDADADTYIDTDTVGDGSGDVIDVYVNGTRTWNLQGSFSTARHDVFVLNTSAGSAEQLRLSGNSIAKTSAPPRGVVSRDNICFAWGRVDLDPTGNSASLIEGHNIDTVTWVDDSTFDVVFHNTASSSSMAIFGHTGSLVVTRVSAVATTGFTITTNTAATSTRSYYIAVFTKDVT